MTSSEYLVGPRDASAVNVMSTLASYMVLQDAPSVGGTIERFRNAADSTTRFDLTYERKENEEAVDTSQAGGTHIMSLSFGSYVYDRQAWSVEVLLGTHWEHAEGWRGHNSSDQDGSCPPTPRLVAELSARLSLQAAITSTPLTLQMRPASDAIAPGH
ncbi:hypothetical protein C8Q73DRAFT_669083 [Cubamyces lactineus]|nr:hypothetical protein C8Q73DRAFT_669083 [Cubamyces lactineus]